MFTFKAGDVRPASAFLLFRSGLTDGVGDGVSRGGLGGCWDALLPVGPGDRWSASLSMLMSLFESFLEEDEDLWDVLTSASLSAARELCRVSLHAKMRKLLCNTTSEGEKIRFLKS